MKLKGLKDSTAPQSTSLTNKATQPPTGVFDPLIFCHSKYETSPQRWLNKIQKY